MENSYRFYANTACKYYPCHEGLEEFSCLFCYCPLNHLEHCPGNPQFLRKKDGTIIKNCTYCNFPHDPAHYDIMINYIKANLPVFSEEVLAKQEARKAAAEDQD